MATWLVGDIHGCAAELAELVEKLNLGPDDNLVSVGDLFHRGPDPIGVMDVLQDADAHFILGNHELRVLERFGLDPSRSDGSDRPPLREDFGELADADLAGDGRRPCIVPAHRRAELLVFLQSHSGFFCENSQLPTAGPTHDGRPWCAVHAGLAHGKPPQSARPDELTSLRRLPLRGKPFWYDVYNGSNLIIFGHSTVKIPRARHQNGRLISLGIDTGCVYGGALTAYSPELNAFEQVKAKANYAVH